MAKRETRKKQGRANEASEDPSLPAPDADRPAGPAVVAFGASAGGLEALVNVLGGLPSDLSVPVLVAQHMDPDHPSHLAEALVRSTQMPVKEAKAGMVARPGHIYICPSDAEMAFTSEGALTFREPVRGRPERVDYLFASVAAASGERAIVVVLSGTGSDGTNGSLAVKRQGGTVIAEGRASARYYGMPNSAIVAGVVDFVKPAGEIGPLIQEILNGDAVASAEVADGQLESVLELLSKRRGVSFELYRKPTLRRRLHKRMLDVGIADIDAYARYVADHPEELDRLFDTLLINVTEFFRDPDAWAAFARHSLPDLVERVKEGETVRIWCAGCASGEEPYSVAILFAEALPDTNDWQRVKIFATDIDESALQEARAGRYEFPRLANVSQERLGRFFRQTGTHREIIKPIRRMVIFGRHDLAGDPPIGRLGAIVCRNVLIYFDAPLQRRVVSAFHYALDAGGALFLGRSEDIVRDDRFEAVDRKWRVFRRRGGASKALARMPVPGTGMVAQDQGVIDDATRTTGLLPAHVQPLLRFVVESAELGIFLLDASLNIQYASAHAGRLLGQGVDNLVGKSFRELLRNMEASDLRVIDDAIKQPSVPKVQTLRLMTRSRQTYVDFTVESYDAPEGGRGLVVMAQDVSVREETRTAARERARELQETVEESQTTNEELQSANEELVTANEELQSSNEELATLNEEFQSTNEELETTNEELLSTNTELEAVNQELQRTAGEVDELNVTIERIGLTSRDPIVVCDADLRIRRWSDHAGEVFGHHARDVTGWNLHSVDFRVEGDVLRALVEEARKTDGAVASPHLVLHGGGRVEGRFCMSQMRDAGGVGIGYLLMFLDETRLGRLQREATAAAARYEALLAIIQHGVVVLDENGQIVQATATARALLADAELGDDAQIWDFAAGTSQRLEIKGAVVDAMQPSPGKRSPHALDVALKSGEVLKFEIVPIGGGIPPIILVHGVDLAEARTAGGAP